MEYILEFIPLMATDGKTYSQIVYGVGCRNFEIYNENHGEEISMFFNKVYIIVNSEKKELSKFWKMLTLKDLRKVYNDVLAERKKEVIYEEEIQEKTFEDLDEYSKCFMMLIFKYGEKLGGLAGISHLSPTEVIDYFNIFNNLEKIASGQIEELSNG